MAKPHQGKAERKGSRQRVHLSVRYETAKDFVVEYAENLSQGGVFVGGAKGLVPLSEVAVQVSLPGAGEFKLLAVVAHIITEEVAREKGCRAGAGLAIKTAPEGFDEALTSYLLRLGRRKDFSVMVSNPESGHVLQEAGYQIALLPPLRDLVESVARAEPEVIAVIVLRAEFAAYDAVARDAGAGDIVIAMDSAREIDSILSSLDERL